MDRSACVIGAAGGIGAAVVKRLKADGWNSIIEMDLNAGIRCDVSNEGSVRAAFAEARRIVPKIDLLVVAAGIIDLDRLPELTLERWNFVISTNLSGPFICCKEADSWMADGGSIVLVSSLAAKTGGAMAGTAYAVSKGGVEVLTKSMAHYYSSRSIKVNCVSPGGVLTPMMANNPAEERAALAKATPLKRMAQPEEIAAAIAFLGSSDASFITGVTLAVNGGIRMD